MLKEIKGKASFKHWEKFANLNFISMTIYEKNSHEKPPLMVLHTYVHIYTCTCMLQNQIQTPMCNIFK